MSVIDFFAVEEGDLPQFHINFRGPSIGKLLPSIHYYTSIPLLSFRKIFLALVDLHFKEIKTPPVARTKQVA